MSCEYDKDRVVKLIDTIRKNDHFRDVTLVAGADKQKFPVHRIVLAASNPYFEKLFNESARNEIPILEVSGPTLKTIIDYCYGCVTKINKDNAENILVAASSLKLTELVTKCSNFWINKVDVSNCVDYMAFAEKYNIEHLKEKSFACICKRFEKIASDAMVCIDEKNFEAILREEDLSATEDKIFNAFVQWVQHDETNRSKLVPALANCIQLEHISKECLGDVVEPFYEKHGCVKLVTDEYRRRTRDPKPIRLHRYSSLYCVTRSYDSKDELETHEYNQERKEFGSTRKIKFDMRNISDSIFLDGKLYAFGKSCDFQSYDLATSEKEALPKMPFYRWGSCLVAFEKFIYMFGPDNRGDKRAPNEIVTECTRFDTEQKVWQTLKSLPQKMAYLSAVELNGLIYVAGHIDPARKYPSNFWFYDPDQNEWTVNEQIDYSYPYITKVKENICIFNGKAGFKMYDLAMDHWKPVEPILHGPINVKEPNYHLTGTLELKDTIYAIIETRTGPQLVTILEPKLDLCDITFACQINAKSKMVYLFNH